MLEHALVSESLLSQHLTPFIVFHQVFLVSITMALRPGFIKLLTSPLHQNTQILHTNGYDLFNDNN